MNHGYPPPRPMVPQGGPSQRLNELLDNIRTEFETESQRSVEYESQSKYCPATIVAPISGRGGGVRRNLSASDRRSGAAMVLQQTMAVRVVLRRWPSKRLCVDGCRSGSV